MLRLYYSQVYTLKTFVSNSKLETCVKSYYPFFFRELKVFHETKIFMLYTCIRKKCVNLKIFSVYLFLILLFKIKNKILRKRHIIYYHLDIISTNVCVVYFIRYFIPAFLKALYIILSICNVCQLT